MTLQLLPVNLIIYEENFIIFFISAQPTHKPLQEPQPTHKPLQRAAAYSLTAA
jgi:hypothetical protein